MNHNDLLQKALQKHPTNLPKEFELKVMEKITAASRKKDKQILIFNYTLVSVVSAILITFTALLLQGK